MKKDILISYFLKNLNKKILKKINFSLVLILMCISLNAQKRDYYANSILKEKSSPELELLDSIYNNAPYILKGTVIDYTWKGFLKDGDKYYCSYLIQIDEVYRGHKTLKEGTIELIIEIKEKARNPLYFSSIGHSYIWACKKSDIQKKYYSPSTNSTNLSLFCRKEALWEQASLKVASICENKVDINKEPVFDYGFLGFDIAFKTKNELDDIFFNKRYNLKPSKPLANPKLEKKKKKKALKRKKIRKKNKKRLKAWKAEQKRLQKIAKANMSKLKSKSINTEYDIEFGFDNIETTEDENGSYLEFDITAKTNTSSSYLRMALLKIRYESDINDYPFKKFITEDDPTDFYLIRSNDFPEDSYNMLNATNNDTDGSDENTFSIMLLRDNVDNPNSDAPLTEITFFPKSLMRVKMKFNDISVAKSILNETTNIEISTEDEDYIMFGSLTEEFDISQTILYDQTIFPTPNPYPMPLAVAAPPPTITGYEIEDANGVSLGATTTMVGVGHTLVIKGTNFGTKTPNSTVLLELADATEIGDNTYPSIGVTGGKPLFKCRNYDILSWTNTEIKVPLHYEYVEPDEYHVQREHKVYARTGYFGISKTGLINSSDVVLSSSMINIKYALAGKTFLFIGTTIGTTTNVLIPKHNCINGFIFRIDQDIAGNTNLLKTVKIGLKHWSDYLGITLKLEMNTLNQPVINDVNQIIEDGINTICIGSTSSIAEANKILTNAGNDHYYFKEADIVMSSSVTWEDYLGVTSGIEYDFYEAFMHELGHVIGLGHSNNLGDLMKANIQMGHNYFPLFNAASVAPNAKAGGNKVVTLSENVSSNYWSLSSEDLLVLNCPETSCTCDGRPSTPYIYGDNMSAISINLNWSTVNNATDYIIECSTEGTNEGFSPIQTLQHPTASYIYIGTSPNTDYYFRMRALNNPPNSRYSDYSPIFSIRTPSPNGILYPSSPSELNTDKKQVELPSGGYDDCIEITWVDNSDDETGFIIQRSTSATTNFTTIATVDANETIYTDCDIELNTEYFYKIFALNDAGMSASSEVISETFAGDDCISDLYLCGNFQNYIVGNPSIAERAYSCTDETQAKIPANGGFHIIADDFIELNPGFEVSEGGEFIAEVIDGICETNFDNMQFMNGGTSDIEDLDNSPIQVYPNPNNGIFTIHFNGNNTQGVIVYDMMSKVVLSIENPKNQENIDLSNYANGMYVVKVIKDKDVETFQIIKE